MLPTWRFLTASGRVGRKNLHPPKSTFRLMCLRPNSQYHRKSFDERRNRCQPSELRSTSYCAVSKAEERSPLWTTSSPPASRDPRAPPRLRRDVLRARRRAHLPVEGLALHQKTRRTSLRSPQRPSHLRQPQRRRCTDTDRLHAGRVRALLRPDGRKGGRGRASRRGHGAVARGDHGRSTHRRAPGQAVIRAPAHNSPEEVPREPDRRAL
jgi:hypothetical protein